MPNIKLKRLESLALRELSLWLIEQSKDDRLKEISITEVRITNDLSYMTIFYTFYQGEVANYQKALEECKGYLRSELARKLKARKMPELIFKYDESLAYGNHIEDLLQSVKK